MRASNTPCTRILAYRPPRIAVLFVVIATPLDLLLGEFLPTLRAPAAVAPVIGSAGFLLMLRAWWLFRKAATAICPTATASVLITSDVYRLTRNPMYLGMVLMMIAVAFYTGSLFHLAAAILFFTVIDHSFCSYEEARLELNFGATFRRYAATTRRWL